MITESFQWLRNCIQSSKNDFHLICCRKLIELFKTQFEQDNECKLMVDDLLTELSNKETSISI